MGKEFCVYVHTFPNGKQYVGITSQRPERRWRKGKGYSSNKRLTNAINKYGWENIEHKILFTGLTAEEAEKAEINLIKENALTDEMHGYNLAPGGDHPIHSESTKKKIGLRSLGRKHSEEFKRWISTKNSGCNNYMYGKHHSDETRKKISEVKKSHHLASVNLGKFGGEHPSSKAILGLSPDNSEVVKRYESIVDASIGIGRSRSCLQAALHGKAKTCGGLMWVYENG